MKQDVSCTVMQDFAVLRNFLPEFRTAMHRAASAPDAGPKELAACARLTARTHGHPLAIRFAERIVHRLTLALAHEATSLEMITWIEQGTGIRVPFTLRMAAWERCLTTTVNAIMATAVRGLDEVHADLIDDLSYLRETLSPCPLPPL